MKPIPRNLKNSKDILNLISYSDMKNLKTIISLVINSDLDVDNDLSLLVIRQDILSALKSDSKVLTPKQRYVIIEHVIKDVSQPDIAKNLNMTQQGVSTLLISALDRIKKHLMKEEIKWTKWTEEEKQFLLDNYKVLGVNETCRRLNKDRSRVVNMYHCLRRAKNELR